MREHANLPLSMRIAVPATSANVGAGFDCAAVALGLYDTIELTLNPTGGIHVELQGEGADELPRDQQHTVVATMLDALSSNGFPAPGVRMRCHNRIAQGRGLGSSAAAVVAGLVAAQVAMHGKSVLGARVDAPAFDGSVVDGSAVGRSVVEGTAAAGAPACVQWFALADEHAGHLLNQAAALEGHADNAAACLFGALAITHQLPASQQPSHANANQKPSAKRWQATTFTVDPRVQVGLFIPGQHVATQQARQVLPPRVPLADAAANAGAAALLPTALQGRADLLVAATQDRLHQQYRASLMAASAELIATLRSQGLAAYLSGAGPTVAVLGYDEPGSSWQQLADTASAHAAAGMRYTQLPLAHHGVQVAVL